jgi:membrane-associated phospholipid phosphatase
MNTLIPRRLRVPTLLAAALAWTIMLTVGGLVSGRRRPTKLDGVLSRGIDHLVGERSRLADVLVTPTDALVVLTLVVLLVAVGLITHRWTVAILAVAGPGLAVGIAELVLKPVFDRRMYGALSYPSGHTVTAVATLTVALLVLTSGASLPRKLLIVPIWAVVVLVLMAGLVAMDYHYPTDAIGGFCLSVGVVLPLTVLADHLDPRRRRTPAGIPRPRAGGSPDPVRNPEPAERPAN